MWVGGTQLAQMKSGSNTLHYTYDAWGNLFATETAENDTIAATLATLNPLRYRGYVYDTETGLYYVSSRYYDPEIGRFINTDDIGLLGANGDFASLNLFAYCGNNPVSRYDITGKSWIVAAAGIAVALISGISNAINTASPGGTVEECLLAGLVGVASGGIGFAIAYSTKFSQPGCIAARAVSSLICNLGTALVLNGSVTWDDVGLAAVDVTFNVCISTVTYYYNPLADIFQHNTLDAIIDGLVDYAEVKILYNRNQTAEEYRRIKKLTFMETRLT